MEATPRRSASPTGRFSSSLNSYSLRFSVDRIASSPSTARSQMMSKKPGGPGQKRSCMCSPTNHPGSFRCKFHKKNGNTDNINHARTLYCSNKMRRSAMVNSLVKNGTVEGVDRRSLASLIRPSSHQLRRRENFRRRNSRLSMMSRTGS